MFLQSRQKLLPFLSDARESATAAPCVLPPSLDYPRRQEKGIMYTLERQTTL